MKHYTSFLASTLILKILPPTLQEVQVPSGLMVGSSNSHSPSGVSLCSRECLANSLCPCVPHLPCWRVLGQECSTDSVSQQARLWVLAPKTHTRDAWKTTPWSLGFPRHSRNYERQTCKHIKIAIVGQHTPCRAKHAVTSLAWVFHSSSPLPSGPLMELGC
jgi:hypothetical protein